ncbi:MAG: hypothetical protein EB829_01885 [Nitrosopumilus sp. H8]|nr:MAG: hypothetical protein EB829_01885 [Nitrosopumilus sp. H8]
MEFPSSGIESAKEKLDKLIHSTGAYQYSAEGFRLVSGKTSEFYFDLKLLNGDPEGLYTVAMIFYHHIKKLPDVRAVGGLESGSISIAAAISQLSYIENKKDDTNPKITSFFVRKEQKLHGTKKSIEGKITSPVVIIDDVITSGMSAISAVNAVEKAGHKCKCLMSIIFRGNQRQYEEITKSVPLQYVFAKEQFTKQLTT